VLNYGTHIGRGKNSISLHGCGVEKTQLIFKKKRQNKKGKRKAKEKYILRSLIKCTYLQIVFD
jgi:hypothetical protein